MSGVRCDGSGIGSKGAAGGSFSVWVYGYRSLVSEGDGNGREEERREEKREAVG